MKNNYLVSVIVPIYNVDKYVSKCINSIINQDYKNLEIILVNDGSKDNSLKICKEYQKTDKRIVIIDKKNGGVSSARNAGVKLAKGDYVTFVDGDDYLETDFVSYMINNMISKKCDFAISKNCFRDDNDKQIIKEHIQILNSAETTALLLSMRINVGCWNKMYKRSLIKNIPFNENQFFGEGLLFITTIAQKISKSVVFERKIYHYRQDNYLSATKKYKYENFINGEKSLKLIENNLILKDKNVYNQLYAHYCMFYCNAISSTLKYGKKNEYIESYKHWQNSAKKNLKYILFNKYITAKAVVKSIVLLYIPFVFRIKYYLFN